MGSQGSQDSGIAPPSHEELLNAYCDVQQHVQRAVAFISRLEQRSSSLISAVQELTMVMQRQQQELDVVKQELHSYKFLALVRDHISQFRMRLVLRISKLFSDITTWELLSAYLQDEQQQPGEEQPVTAAVKEELEQIGFSWGEWQQLREVADAAVQLFHTGKPATIDAALAQLNSQPMPPSLQHTKAALQKALLYVKSAHPLTATHAAT